MSDEKPPRPQPQGQWRYSKRAGRHRLLYSPSQGPNVGDWVVYEEAQSAEKLAQAVARYARQAEVSANHYAAKKLALDGVLREIEKRQRRNAR